ncbi:MAG TPA: hypothetical protein VF279_01675 [Acidimicrobiales bacterium]
MDWNLELIVVPVALPVPVAPGLDPERGDYGTVFTFSDPDGNGRFVQEVRDPTADE